MVDFFDFGLVAIVVCGEIVGDALLQRTVGNEVGDAASAAIIVERHYDTIYAVAYLAGGRGVVCDDHGLA